MSPYNPRGTGLDRRLLATVQDYDGLVAALRNRAGELGLTFELIDLVAGFTARYASKVLGPSKTKNIGRMSFDALLGTLGLKVVLIEDPEALAKVQGRFQERHSSKAQGSGEARLGKMTLNRVYVPVIREMSRRAAEARRVKIPPEKRRQLARMAARARWLRRVKTP